MIKLSSAKRISMLLGTLAAGLSCAAHADCPTGGTCFDVISTVDRVDRIPGDGVCDTPPNFTGGSPGPCTLRAAVMEANASATGAYFIRLAADTYSLTRPSISVPDLEDYDGSLNIFADNISITGPGDGAYAVIRGSDTFGGRLVHVGGGQNFTVRDVEFTAAEHGVTCSLPNNAPGAGSVDLTRVRMHHLVSVQSQDGGAISSSSDCQWDVADSEFWANDGGGRGSAIYIGAGGSLTALRTALIGNGGADVPAISEGTALFATSANVILENVTVAGNHTGQFGAIGVGGDISQGPSLLVMRSVTIARNSTSESVGTAGLYMEYGSLDLKNSVVADNVGGNGDLRFDLDAQTASGGYNVFGPVSPESGSYSQSLQSTDRTDRVNVGLAQVPTTLPAAIGATGLQPTLGGLLINQGNPLPFSDVTADGACPIRDTSGRKRRAGGRCDIGAMEYFPTPWTFHAVQLADAVDGDPGDGVCSSVVLPGAPNAATCTLRAAVMESAQLHADGHVGVFLTLLVPGDHQLGIGDADDDDPASGDLDVDGFELAVRGDATLAEAASTVRAVTNFPDRLFDVKNSAQLNLIDVALADANIQPIDGVGAAVACGLNSVLTVRGGRLSNLHAWFGAAIAAASCEVSILDSDIVDNDGSGGWGGTIYGVDSTIGITRSSLRGNRSTQGSAIHSDIATKLTMTAVTVSGNKGLADNAAVVLSGGSKAWLRNVTITDNAADPGATDRGALLVFDPASELTLINSIVAGNAGGSDIYIVPGATVVEGFNLIGTLVPGSSPWPGSGQPSGVGALTQLSATALAWGHIPVPNGPAHNAGNPTPGFSDDPASPLCARYDQSYRDRGLDPDHLCDIGAVEYFADPPPPVPLDTIFKNDFEEIW